MCIVHLFIHSFFNTIKINSIINYELYIVQFITRLRTRVPDQCDARQTLKTLLRAFLTKQ